MGKSILNLETQEKAQVLQKHITLFIEKYQEETTTDEQMTMIDEAIEALYQALDPRVVTNLEAYIPE